MSDRIVRCELEYDNGKIEEVAGKEAAKWQRRVDGACVMASVHGMGAEGENLEKWHTRRPTTDKDGLRMQLLPFQMFGLPVFADMRMSEATVHEEFPAEEFVRARQEWEKYQIRVGGFLIARGHLVAFPDVKALEVKTIESVNVPVGDYKA